MKESFPQIERLELNRVLFSLFFSSMGNTMEKSILAYVYFPFSTSFFLLLLLLPPPPPPPERSMHRWLQHASSHQFKDNSTFNLTYQSWGGLHAGL
jgi:hypothetical protein